MDLSMRTRIIVMSEFIRMIASSSIGAVIAAAIGYGMFCLQRRIAIRDEFLGVIDAQRAKLEVIVRINRLAKITTPNTNEDVFFEESIAVFVSAVRKVQRVLPKRQRLRLGKVLEEYKSNQTQYKGRTRKSVEIRSGNFYSDTLKDFLGEFENAIQ
jgi:hypothetical protein